MTKEPTQSKSQIGYEEDHAAKLQVADQGIELVLKKETGVDVNRFNPLKYYNPSDSSSIKLVVYQRRLGTPKAKFDASNSEMSYYCTHLSVHPMRMLLSYLAGHYSEVYDSVHGSGVVVSKGMFRGQKGVLLTGPHGSGKSTLAKALGAKKILDDDILLTDGDSMCISGRMGSVTLKNKDLYFQKKGIKESSLDRVFLLDKHKEGGFLEEVDNQIPRDQSVFDVLPSNLYSIYTSLPPIITDARVFVLGIKGNQKHTIKAIKSTL